MTTNNLDDIINSMTYKDKCRLLLQIHNDRASAKDCGTRSIMLNKLMLEFVKELMKCSNIDRICKEIDKR